MTMTRDLVSAGLALAAGALVGYWHFRALREEVRAIATQGATRTILWQRGSRMAATLALFLIAAQGGGPAMIAALAGWLGARRVALRANAPQPAGASAGIPGESP